MTTADDLLTRPLGLERERASRRPAWLKAIRPTPILAAGLVSGGVALGLYLALVSDPLGGEPHAFATIEMRAPPTQAAPVAPAPPAPAAAPPQEAVAGIGVVRPAGPSAPGAIIIRIPDAPGAAAAPAGLAPAPDRRLVERGRHGALPRVGEDGARALDVYARPSAETLASGGQPAGRIAILVYGLGIGRSATADAIARLPPAVTLAFSPYGSDLEREVARAREAGHEAMLQAPMEPFDYPDNDPGPQTLLVGARGAENADRLAWIMARVAGIVGLVNAMGGRMLAEEGALTPLLREVGARGLGFLDDGTAARSVAVAVGARVKAPTSRAESVIDAVPRAEAIDRELARLEGVARKQGFVLASAGAGPLTIERLARWSKELEGRGILLVPASRALRGR